MPETSTPTPATPSAPSTSTTPGSSLGDAVINQLLAGPTSSEVAARLLREALKKLYPTLNLDPNNTVVGEPGWDIINGELVELSTRYQTLSNILAARQAESDPTLLVEGFHFLSQLPLVTPEVHLPVRISQIGGLINELVPVMTPACQEQQLAYWNTSRGSSAPRWHDLSNTLRKLWDVSQVPGWTATECDMARQLFLYPTLKDRTDHGRYDTHAYLIDVDEVEGDKVTRLIENMLVVLIGQIDKQQTILAYSLRNGYEKFDSLHALGLSIPGHLGVVSSKKIQWRLYEPAGNLFDYKACGLIATQIKILNSPEVLERFMSEEGDQPAANGLNVADGPSVAWFENQMPDWLRQASISDQVQFAQHMKNLSALSSFQAGKTYQDDIPTLKRHASTALKQQMQTEHANASTLDPEKIEIQVQTPVVWGTFFVPGAVDTTRFSLVELALQNLIALPLGNKVVRSLDGKTLPAWMTVDYIEALITKIDIGRVYPELVKSKLLDDQAESVRRQELYTSQLRIQLPMLALENKIRGQGNIDERGYRYVAALMEPEEADRKVDGQTVVLRKLAFMSNQPLSTSEDAVTNMFVIGPQDLSAGPCVLYRPLLEPQLIQYPTPSNLLYAIRQTPDLRQSVLAWLPDETREYYNRYVFSGTVPSPWAIVEFTADPFWAWSNSAPVSLSDTHLGTDFLPLLFKANADALVELADRQSVSNRENRWQTFKHASWLIFNLALPYLGTTVGTATWLWQILDDVETLTQPSENSNNRATWDAFVDLLLNIAMAITAHAIERAQQHSTARRVAAPETLPKLENLVKPPLIIEKLPPLTSKELPFEHYDAIHSSGALAGKSGDRATLLDAFAIDPPAQPGELQTEGALKGLYQQADQWYAKMAGKWFKVMVENERVSVVDGKDPTRAGPALRHTYDEWHIDTRLRLRGGGARETRQKVIQEAKSLSTRLLVELNRFEQKKPEGQTLLTMNARQLNKATSTSKETKRIAYLSTLKTQRESYEEALKILTEWPVFQSRPDAPQVRLSYLNAQINFTFEEINALKERFTPVLRDALEMSTSGVEEVEQQHVDTADGMIRIGEDMIERLDYMETRFSNLKKLGREGFEFVRDYRGKMPAYKSDAIRLIQLDMYRHLCLTLESVNRVPEGWADINQMVDNTTVAFQSLHDAVQERSVIRLDEQIDTFGSLTEQFTAIEEHLEYVRNEYKDHVRPAELNRLGRQIAKLKTQTLAELSRALDERSTRRNLGNAYEQRPRTRKKFIRARFWGLVSGEVRLNKLHEETDWLDVKNPLTDKIIATFHRKETGEWVPHANAEISLAIPTLATSVTKGRALVNGLAAFKTQLEQYMNNPNRSPAGIGIILNAHAARMEKVGAAIKKALDNLSNETVSVPLAEQRLAESTRLELKKASKALYEEGFETVLKVIKQRPPTMSGVIWLKSRNLISITRQKQRQRIKRPIHAYLDRYEIRDRIENKTLWFADFQYSTDWVPAHAYLSARLKTPEQANTITANNSLQELSELQLINYYRSEIAMDQAKEVFFTKRSS
ncbi:dermonecrotic toxin domain-containing protein [Pseudomonas citri]|uniref:dermonecrotic toxin domain-containing protein n=1 Tax=Pseudomonas citri TaxID=2978349 RepID=UPI0021B4D54C|nr:DUF6543 domain-containing protein [Pseudomonas citri]